MVESYSDAKSSTSEGSVKETIAKLDQVHIDQNNVADFYNEIGADGYDEWA